jgi:hypothetical protein
VHHDGVHLQVHLLGGRAAAVLSADLLNQLSDSLLSSVVACTGIL